jgi:hypothetical protein
MIPDLVPLAGSPWPVLPPGIHQATLQEVEVVYATSGRRRKLFDGLVQAAYHLRKAGCDRIYIDGSYVTAKPKPGDYDACWDPSGVQRQLLHPVFFEFSNGRAAQKKTFGGEFFPSSAVEGQSQRAFLSFFQVDRHSGQAKGIIEVTLTTDTLLDRRAQ